MSVAADLLVKAGLIPGPPPDAPHAQRQNTYAPPERHLAPVASSAAPRLHSRAMRGLAGEVVRTFAPHTEASPTAILFQFLVAFGSAVGRNPYVPVGETRHHANQYVLVVGRSSRARKGDSKNAALRTVRDADPSWFTHSGLSTGEGLIHAVRDEIRKPDRKGELALLDPGVLDKRLCVVESEFASVLKVMMRDANTLSATLRAGWDGDDVLQNLSKGAGERATNAHISLIAHATPADLAKYLSETDAANGFANRFAIIEVERAGLLPNPTIPEAAVVAAVAARVRRALTTATTRRAMLRTPKADELWRQIYPALSSDKPGLVGDLLARAEAHVLRFALIYALLDESEVTDVDHILAAVALWEACEQSVQSVFRGRTGSKYADKIACEIPPGTEMSRSEIRDEIFSNHISAAQLSDAIDLLASMPEWRVIELDTEGRPAEILRHLQPDERERTGGPS